MLLVLNTQAYRIKLICKTLKQFQKKAAKLKVHF